LKLNRELLPVLVTVGCSVAFNMAVGFCVGIAVHYLMANSTKSLVKDAERNEHDTQ
jgi:MFS superfamily sulfate permease-like transporter